MMESVLPEPGTPFGERVRRRLREEQVIWITTVGRDGTPQPNPVGFLLQDDNSILVYNAVRANRTGHVADRPRVSLHFDGDGAGGDIVVFTGTARRVDDAPPPAAREPGMDGQVRGQCGPGVRQRGELQREVSGAPADRDHADTRPLEPVSLTGQ